MAIVFAISQISITSISEKYTPYVLNKYIEDIDTKISFFGLIITVIASTLFLYINELLSSTGNYIWSIFLISIFLISLAHLVKYFYFVFSLINPLSFSSIMSDTILTNVGFIKNKNLGEKAEVVLYSMDYISESSLIVYSAIYGIKSYEKEEIIEVLPYFEEIENWTISMGDVSIKSIQSCELNTARDYIDKLQNVFRHELTTYNSMWTLQYILNSFGNILKFAFRSTDDIRFMVMSKYLEIPSIFIASSQTFPSKKIFYSYDLFLKKLFDLNKFIIDKNDYDLFKDEVNGISLAIYLQEIEGLKESIESNLDELFVGFDSDIESKVNDVKLLIKHDLMTNFSNIITYESIFQKIHDVFLSNPSNPECSTYESKFKELEKEIFDFYICSKINLLFLVIGSYCIFVGRENNKDSLKYLKLLWFYTVPEDSDTSWGNTVPVPSDLEFLFNMLFFGGTRNNNYWYESYHFEGYHGSKPYIIKYVLLRVTYLLHRGKNFTINISRSISKSELVYKRLFITTFISQTEELLGCCDRLISESKEWDSFFPKIEQSTQLFQHTKEWISAKEKEFESILEEIKKI
ncbi:MULTISPECIES: hypothetical protein [unclassified Methanosarcina]|uniref:hypothetical protein n=1 Tax=unclassified Methanosarcina TaxID=2644672 RepID=UPI0012E01ADD|nr:MULTISPECIES: hypothetical protein [unclassified Methanosarcina]